MTTKSPLQHYRESQLLAFQALVDRHHGRPLETQINTGRARYSLGLALCNGDKEMELGFEFARRTLDLWWRP